jgi:hypothetical protein
MRAYNPQLAGNKSILKVVKNGVGMKSIKELIDQTISKLGSDRTEKSGYSSKQEG